MTRTICDHCGNERSFHRGDITRYELLPAPARIDDSPAAIDLCSDCRKRLRFLIDAFKTARLEVRGGGAA